MAMTRHDVLIYLGPGGTTELADRVLELLDLQTTTLGDLELGGLTEVSELLGEDRQTVGHWIAGRRWPTGHPTPHFPEPLAKLKATPVWDLATVRAWGVEVGILMDSNSEAIHV